MLLNIYGNQVKSRNCYIDNHVKINNDEKSFFKENHMLTAIIIVISCILAAIGLGIFFLIKLIMHYKEIEIRNKNIIRLAIVVILTIILGGVNIFLIFKYSIDKIKTGINNSSLPITSEST